MKIAQVCNRRFPSPVHNGGGDVRRWQDLCALTDLGHEVHVVVCNPKTQPTAELKERASSVQEVHPKRLPPWRPENLIARAVNAEIRDLKFSNLFGLQRRAHATVGRIDPDLIWAEQSRSVPLCPHDRPVVNAHLDFMFKLRPVRTRSYARWLRRPDTLSLAALEKLEVDMCRRVTYNMCGSQSEADFLTARGIRASYLPVVGPTVARPNFENLPDCRLYLFGNPNTAMRAARHNLQTEIWPVLDRRKEHLNWHQLGDTPRPGADPSWPWVEKHFEIHGHVPDLADVLRPGDASVMPYPFDTGGRAKFGVSAGYGVVNIAYEETFLCASEFTHQEDSLAASTPEHFAELLAQFSSDRRLRRRLAEGSRATYERHHTMEVQLPHYEEILRVVAGR